MLHFNVRSNSKGFTLIEVLVVMIMIGILSAIAAPSFLGLLNRNRVNNATIRLKSAITEAQVNATRVAKSCTPLITAGTGSVRTLSTYTDAVSYTNQNSECWRNKSTNVSTTLLELSPGDYSFVDTSSKLRIVNGVNTTPVTAPDPNNLRQVLFITFDFKGRISPVPIPTTPLYNVANYSASGGSDNRAIVVSLLNSFDGAGYERCVMISQPLGIVRMGEYTNSTSTCKIDP